MQRSLQKAAVITVALVAAAALAGCASVSSGITKDGTHAQQLVWPQTSDANALRPQGTFPNVDNLRQVHAGLNKSQVRALIGSPDFNEGMFHVREWDYLFNFRKAGAVTQCEYKVLFSDSMQVGSTYWHPASCADFVNPPAAATPVAAAHKAQTFTLSASALFAFNKYKLADIKAGGRTQLDQLATKLNAPNVKTEHVDVVGYTDRIGSVEYNQNLSTERADTVRDYLVSHGVDAGRIDAAGRGEADPVATCSNKSRVKLIACLAPNRRVVVKVGATH